MAYSNASLAANSFTNLFSGNIHEILAEDSQVNVYAAGSAVGLNATVMIGGEAVIQDQPISRANRFPIIPDDFLAQGYPPIAVVRRALLGDRSPTL